MFFYLPDLSENGFIEAPATINGNIYYFVFRWNTYCECAFVKIMDANRKVILDDTACRNGLVINIDHRLLPRLELLGGSYPPLKETFKDYYIQWQE